jgi:soluble lytic murein transglycosylase-like protein
MTVEISGAAQVQARMLAIQSRFDRLAPAAAATTAASSFADRLAAFGPGAEAAAGLPSAAPAGGGERVVADAQKYLGVPYKWGGTDPATGLDCSGLVQRVYGDLGITVPRVAADQARVGRPVASLAEARPGDLIAFGSPVDHIGIYAGNNTMIVAPKTGDVVKLQTIYRTPTAIRRVLPDGPASPLGQAAPSTATMAAAPPAYRQLFAAAGARYGVSPDLLAAVARAESNFNADARSSAGALGLMQLMPGTARGLHVDPRDPAQAVDGAARLLAGHLKKYGGSVPLTLAAYNAGPGAVAKYGGIPPYRETQAYVQKVLSYTGGAL